MHRREKQKQHLLLSFCKHVLIQFLLSTLDRFFVFRFVFHCGEANVIARSSKERKINVLRCWNNAQPVLCKSVIMHLSFAAISQRPALVFTKRHWLMLRTVSCRPIDFIRKKHRAATTYCTNILCSAKGTWHVRDGTCCICDVANVSMANARVC